MSVAISWLTIEVLDIGGKNSTIVVFSPDARRVRTVGEFRRQWRIILTIGEEREESSNN